MGKPRLGEGVYLFAPTTATREAGGQNTQTSSKLSQDLTEANAHPLSKKKIYSSQPPSYKLTPTPSFLYFFSLPWTLRSHNPSTLHFWKEGEEEKSRQERGVQVGVERRNCQKAIFENKKTFGVHQKMFLEIKLCHSKIYVQKLKKYVYVARTPPLPLPPSKSDTQA